MSVSEWMAQAASKDFEKAELGDPRRLCEITRRVSEEPAASFPEVFSRPAELEGFYRFMRSEHVGWEKILEAHLNGSCERGDLLSECLVIHDTTEFNFRGSRRGTGKTSSNGHGFFAHASLLVATNSERTPLGLGALQQYARQTPGKGREQTNLEGERWLRGAKMVEERAAGRFQCIHVADREADSFHFLHGMVEMGSRFVVRVSQDRNLEDEFGDIVRLHEPLMRLDAATQFEVEICQRSHRSSSRQARTHPNRRSRTARLSAAGTHIIMPKSRRFSEGTSIELNVVRVWEEEPPSDEPPVEWLLWTTEPTQTPEQIHKVVEFYRARWAIEEYFKALKTGCNLEKRQLESFETLTAAVAIFAPVAWKLLLLRSLARNAPTRPPTDVLTPVQVKYLEHKYQRPLSNIREALLATAQLGGHIKRNGEPGWQTLGKGYEKLVAGEAFLDVLAPKRTCDQS